MKSDLFDRCAEDIRVRAIVIAELKFRDIERQVLVTDLREGSNDAALNQRPEAFDRLSMDRADDMLPIGVDRPRRADSPCPVSCSLSIRQQSRLTLLETASLAKLLSVSRFKFGITRAIKLPLRFTAPTTIALPLVGPPGCSLLASEFPDPVRVVSAIREQHRLWKQGAEKN
jgi:hypothetical protein